MWRTNLLSFFHNSKTPFFGSRPIYKKNYVLAFNTIEAQMFFCSVFLKTHKTQGWEFDHRVLVFCDQNRERDIGSWIRVNCSCCSFLKIDTINLLTVAFLSWSMGAIPHGCSFVKSDESELILSIFKEERLSKERQERFTLLAWKGGKLSKTNKKYVFFKQIALFW